MIDLLATALAAPVPSHAQRRAILLALGERLAAQRDELAAAITASTGKPVALARGEVDRAIITVRGSAAAIELLAPRRIELGADAGADAEIHRVALGPVLAVTPFNFPLNLALHKLAPAIAAGCPSIHKPSPKAPGVAELLDAMLAGCGSPAGFTQVARLADAEVAGLIADPRLALLSFTGSASVGRRLQAATVAARVILELGGNAALIWHRVADAEAAAARAAFGACAQAGQSCISVQRIFVPDDRPEWVEALVRAFRSVSVGDPDDGRTVCGPVIDLAAKQRIVALLDSYRAAGGRVLCGGTWDGLTLAPTLIDGVDAAHPAVRTCEAFAPLATVHRYRDLDQAFAWADDTPFGLQAGLYSDDQDAIARAFARLRVGTLVVGDIPTRRDDRLPYGGFRDSGCGREGTLASVLDYSEAKVLLRVR